ncbi:helix-turn-helix domain-containing protein (plasmid) [Pseudoalteromonas sp. T1lg65]|uniref:helix-turn-helix domain-containing protein n=1 Tax=Pseudoalteromonas sp. T1lg65 TaxID=2077101 RepID=UPI003F7B1F40
MNILTFFTANRFVKKSRNHLIATAAFLIYVVFLVITHNNILRVGAINSESILVPVPLLLLALHICLVSSLALATDWYARLYNISLMLFGWGSFIYSTNMLVENGVQVTPLVTKPLPMLLVLALTLSAYFYIRARKDKLHKRNNDIAAVKLKNEAYTKKEETRKIQEAKFKSHMTPITTDFALSVKQVIEENLSDPSLDTKSIATKLYMTEKTFTRKFKTQFGVPPGSYLKNMRMAKAYEYYCDKIYPSQKALSAAVGFKSPTYFSQQLQLYIVSQKNDTLPSSNPVKITESDSQESTQTVKRSD